MRSIVQECLNLQNNKNKRMKWDFNVLSIEHLLLHNLPQKMYQKQSSIPTNIIYSLSVTILSLKTIQKDLQKQN